ncbi:MAG: hypothetical protein CSA49_06375 [Gammaproteobacteria bacterium]|nr:MAG: hypothetical protein CSA49_06375 [Gammaproteobacteria bacterium]
MKNSLRMAPVLLTMLPAAAIAGQVEMGTGPANKIVDTLGASVAIVSNDAGKGSDFDTALRFNGYVQKQVSPNLSVQFGLSQSTDAEDSNEDNTGKYKLSISHSDVFGGLKFVANPEDDFSLFARGGLMYYYSQIKLEESFFGLKDAGIDKEIEEGTGFYLGGGVAFDLAPDMQCELEVTYLQRNDYFDKSPRSFDFKETGITLGVVYRLP